MNITNLDNKKIVIKLLFNIAILEEEIILDIPLKEKTSNDIMNNIKDSVYYLNKEKIDIQQEIKSLKKEINDISKYMKEKLNQNDNKEKEIKKYECIREIKNINEKEKEKKIKDFCIIEDYYIKFGGSEIIYNFLCELFEKNKDILKCINKR